MEIKAENQAEIEDANRLCVLAGDFFLAAASTQLSELENQLIVNQISKGIGDMSTGRVFTGTDVDKWVQARFGKFSKKIFRWPNFSAFGRETFRN